MATTTALVLLGETRDDGWLTLAELRVLNQLARGLSNAEIARSLGVAEQTIKFHLTSVYLSLRALGFQVDNRTQAAIVAREEFGLGEEPRRPLLVAEGAPVRRLALAGGQR